MKKDYTYEKNFSASIFLRIYFYFIFFSGLIAFFSLGLLSIRVTLLNTLHFSDGLTAVLMVLIIIPLFIFLVQIFQDLNYRIIHFMGYWGAAVPLFSRRGLTIPKFYAREFQTQEMKSSIEKARYRYRLVAILQWVVTAIVTEAVLGGYYLIATNFNWQIHGVIVVVLLFGTLYLTFSIWDKLQKSLHLTIAYVENEREFFYRQANQPAERTGRSKVSAN